MVADDEGKHEKDAYAERRERILHRLGHERGHRNRAGLAHALDAEWIEGREGLDLDGHRRVSASDCPESIGQPLHERGAV
jgi:hypothetical protein